jgi:hypothetical protein
MSLATEAKLKLTHASGNFGDLWFGLAMRSGALEMRRSFSMITFFKDGTAIEVADGEVFVLDRVMVDANIMNWLNEPETEPLKNTYAVEKNEFLGMLAAHRATPTTDPKLIGYLENNAQAMKAGKL